MKKLRDTALPFKPASAPSSRRDAARRASLEVLDGASLAVSATAHVLPNRLADLVSALDRVRQKVRA